MSNIRNRFYRECAIWKRVDHTLAVAFKAASLPKCVEQAVCEMRGEDYTSLDPAAKRMFSEDFYVECIDLIIERDTTLRSKLLHIMRKREGVNKNQLTFDFDEKEK